MKVILNFISRLMPTGPNEQVFIEAHDESGKSIDVGEWAADGEYETLTIDCDKFQTPSKMLSENRATELYHYASSYETFDENTPNGTPCQHGGIAMNDTRRAVIIAYKKVLGLLPDNYITTLDSKTV